MRVRKGRHLIETGFLSVAWLDREVGQLECVFFAEVFGVGSRYQIVVFGQVVRDGD